MFGIDRGVTQGDPASPIIFNLVVDMVLQAVLEEVCSPQEAQHGMGWEVGENNLFFTRMMEGSWGGITSGCKTP